MDFDTLKAGDTDTILGKVIKEVILTSNTFVVYLDINNTIQWSTSSHTKWGENFGKIQNQVSYWESLCNKLFKPKDAYDCKTLLAEAYARMLDEGDDKSAQEIIDQTVDRIKKQGREILRQQYILSSLITSGLIVIIIILTALNKSHLIKYISYDAYRIFLTGLFGGIGAFISTMLRAKNYEAEITLDKNVHRLDGFLRIIYGLIAGVVISLAIKSNIVLGFIKDADKNNFIEIFIGMIGGASEIILPSIIKKVEDKI